MTRRMYQAMRSVADTLARLIHTPWNNSDVDAAYLADPGTRMSCLPHFATIHRVFRPILFRNLTVRANDSMEHMNPMSGGARANAFSAEGHPQSLVRIVLPSEYARADMGTEPIFSEMCSTSLQRHGQASVSATRTALSECVDTWPIVAARDWFYGQATSTSLDVTDSDNYDASFCEAGDIVRLSLLGDDPVQDSLARAFRFPGSPSEIVLCGYVTKVWTVHHRSRKQMPDFMQSCDLGVLCRDRSLFHALNFVQYCSPSDSVHIPIPDIPESNEIQHADFSPALDAFAEAQPRHKKKRVLPEMSAALKARRAALKKRKLETEKAWQNWTKPLLKPGDIVVMIRLCLTSELDSVSSPQNHADESSRVCIVFRFWAEHEERRRHIFWISGETASPTEDADSFENLCTPPNASGESMYRDVFRVSMLKMYSGKRGIDTFKPVSSLGTLPNGEKYFIYRFLLFWDGFRMTIGKSASGDGFYLQCINFPRQARSSSTAVRILSLTPPGVNIGAVFSRVQNDIIIGMTEGFLDGERRRIFLDLVGFTGDTPARNAELDVMGHTATAFCHLCRVSRQSASLIGSRYVRKGVTGSAHGFSRGFYQHCGVRDCFATGETCRLLGMKPSATDRNLPIHNLRQAMVEAQPSIPSTADGLRIVPGVLDPYRACFIAPDHLLTGHARDCIELAFRLLPSLRHRSTCEAFMIGLLSESNLPQQNRLFDHENKHLFSM